MEALNKSENRDNFGAPYCRTGNARPKGVGVTNIEDGVKAANEIGYPVLVRPSYVLGGRAMQIVSNDEGLLKYLKSAVAVNEDQPVLIDQYIVGKELGEVDAVCDGTDVFVPRHYGAGRAYRCTFRRLHQCLPHIQHFPKSKETILDYTKRLGLGIGIVRPFQCQFIVDKLGRMFTLLRSTPALPAQCLSFPGDRLVVGRHRHKRGLC